MISVGLWDPVCDTDLSVLAGRGERGSLHEENLLQATSALLHSPGHWHALLQRPVSAHPRGSVDAAAVTHSTLAAAPSGCASVHGRRSLCSLLTLTCCSGSNLTHFYI